MKHLCLMILKSSEIIQTTRKQAGMQGLEHWAKLTRLCSKATVNASVYTSESGGWSERVFTNHQNEKKLCISRSCTNINKRVFKLPDHFLFS